LAVLLVAAKWLKTKPQAGNSLVNRSKVELARNWLESRTGLSVQLGLFAGIVLVSLSLGSIVLLSLGWLGLLGLHSSDRWLQRGVRGLLMVALLIPAAYMLVRTTGWLSTERLNTVTQRMVSQERAGSFDYRLRAEETVMAHMHDHWILGWGDWGRWQQGESTLALDGFWLFALTRSGMLTVVVWFAMVAVPVLVRLSGRGPQCAVADGLAIFLLLSLIDSMFNYFGDVHQMLALGTLAAMVGGRRI
jgi:hypothetical protein